MRPIPMNALINGKRYSTQTAVLLAHDDYWDGQSWERDDRNTFLFRGPDGAYFAQHRIRTWSCMDARHDTLEPVSELAAVILFWELPERPISFAEAFDFTSEGQ